MLRVGLTGGIASGKTAVGEMFARRGAHVIQANRIAHELMRPGEKVYDDLVAHFGRGILDADGKISRPKLAEAAFGIQGSGPLSEGERKGIASANRVAELNSIIHPAVISAQREWMDEIGRREPKAVAIVEAALIFEAGVEAHFDKIVVVTCDPEKKAARFARRTQVSLEFAREEVARRSAAQMSDEQKIGRADYVIHNDGSLEQTEAQVQTIWQELANLAFQ